MKFIISLAVAALLAINVDTTNAMQLNKDADQVAVKKDDEFDDKNTPDRFKENSDDIFMRSMYRSYASDIETVDKKTGEKVKTGQQGVTRSSAYQAGIEVLGTHKGYKGGDLTSYMANYFDRAWDHYDVTQKGWISVEMMPMLMRFLASDQLIHIYHQQSSNYTFAVMPKSNATLAKKADTTLGQNNVNVTIKTQKDVNGTLTAERKNGTIFIKIDMTNSTLSQNTKNTTKNVTQAKNATQPKNKTAAKNATVSKNATVAVKK